VILAADLGWWQPIEDEQRVRLPLLEALGLPEERLRRAEPPRTPHASPAAERGLCEVGATRSARVGLAHGPRGGGALVAQLGEAYSVFPRNITNGPGWVYLPPVGPTTVIVTTVWQTVLAAGSLERLEEAWQRDRGADGVEGLRGSA